MYLGGYLGDAAISAGFWTGCLFFDSKKLLVRPSGFETTDLLLRSTANSLQYLFLLLVFSTAWGVCFRSANDPNGVIWVEF